MLCLALRVHAVQSFCVPYLLYFCPALADRAQLWNISDAAPCQVPGNLGNDHIRLVYFNLITDAKLKLLHNADVMDACPAHRRPLQLHRSEDCHRIDKPGSRRAPLNLQKFRHPCLVRPLKRNRIPGELCRLPEGTPICDIIKHKHQAV